MRTCTPDLQQESPLENELVGKRGDTYTIQQTFEGIACKHKIQWLSGLSGKIEKSFSDRGGKIGR
jgi:hypothetical protein